MGVPSAAPRLSWTPSCVNLPPRAQGLPWNVPQAPGPQLAFLALRGSPASKRRRERC